MAQLPVPKHAHRPLTAWVYGGNMYVKSFSHYEGEVILPEFIFVSIDTFFRLHEAPRVPLKSLEQSWVETKDYVLRARALLNRPRAGWSLSDEDRKKVLESIGEPPGPAWPLYVIAVGDYPDERIVYIGKTNAQTHRFGTGHSAITALHAPQYDGMTKRLYMATVTLMSDEGNYVPLEWLHPKVLRDWIWSDLEAQLIYHFQPELNRKLKERDHSKNPVQIAFNNYSGTKSFDGECVIPHRTVQVEDWISVLYGEQPV